MNGPKERIFQWVWGWKSPHGIEGQADDSDDLQMIQEAQLKQGLADRTAKTAVSVAI